MRQHVSHECKRERKRGREKEGRFCQMTVAVVVVVVVLPSSLSQSVRQTCSLTPSDSNVPAD